MGIEGHSQTALDIGGQSTIFLPKIPSLSSIHSNITKEVVVRSVWKSQRQLGITHMESLSCKAKWPGPNFTLVPEEYGSPVVVFFSPANSKSWDVACPKVGGASASRTRYRDDMWGMWIPSDAGSWHDSRADQLPMYIFLLVIAVLHPWRYVVVLHNWGMFSFSMRMGKQHEERVFTEVCFCSLKSSN